MGSRHVLLDCENTACMSSCNLSLMLVTREHVLGAPAVSSHTQCLLQHMGSNSVNSGCTSSLQLKTRAQLCKSTPEVGSLLCSSKSWVLAHCTPQQRRL